MVVVWRYGHLPSVLAMMSVGKAVEVSPALSSAVRELRNHISVRSVRGSDNREQDDLDACEETIEWKISAVEWYDWSRQEAAGYIPKAKMFFNCLDTVRSPLTLMNAAYFMQDVVEPVEIIIPYGSGNRGPVLRMFMENPSAFPPEHEFVIGYSRQNKTATKETLTWVSIRAGDLKRSAMRINPKLFPEVERCDPTQPAFASYLPDGKLRCNLVQIHPEDIVCLLDVGGDALTGACRGRIVNLMHGMDQLEGGKITSGAQPASCKVTSVLVDDNQRAGIEKMTSEFHETQCTMAKNCVDPMGKIPYDVLYVCGLGMNKVLAVPMFVALSFFWFLTMGMLADDFLVPVLCELGNGLHMSDALFGATLLALGSGADAFMAGLVSVLSKAPRQADEVENTYVVKMWLGSVFGGILFQNAFAAGLVLLSAGNGGVPVLRKEFMRNIIFQFTAIALMGIYGFFGFVHWSMALGNIAIYVLYVVLILRDKPDAGDEPGRREISAESSCSTLGQRVGRHVALAIASSSCSESGRDVALSSHSEANDCCALMGYVAGSSVMDNIRFVLGLPFRPLFLVTLALTDWHPCLNILMPFCLCVFIPFGNFFGNLYESAFDGFSESTVIVLGFWVVGLALSISCALAARRTPGVYIKPMLFYGASFVSSMFWFATISNEVIGTLETIGFICGLAPPAIGVTLLAWGTTADAMFCMVGLAKAGHFGLAVTSMYAGPMFNLLFGTGTNLFILAMREGGRSLFVFSANSWALVVGLLCIYIATAGWARTMGWRLTRSLGYMFLSSYISILVVALVFGHIFDSAS